ncbi:MFS transporter [Paenibacillus glycanilyticus]|uniref:MFS transporter n=1 Tax=Paenibacillus glycanilyticus TaxID=126569 RepID=UPI00203D6255|nr:MFS transporter [Paenibacillus glycanilyticus]MCM3628967.1 MFS transporter [Paenibacillus glycanilyticus]
MKQSHHGVKTGGRLPGGTARRSVATGSRQGGALGAQAILLLTVQGLFGVASALSGTFIPIYLWKASQSFMLIGWFTLGQYVTGAITFWLAGKWVKEHHKMYSLRLGIVLSGAFYFTVLMLGQQAKTYSIPIGMLSGMALGFYWMAYNVVYFEITEPDNRDRFNGIAGILGALSGIIAPWVSGFLITTLQGERGYKLIFTISLVIFGLAVVGSFWLTNRGVVGEKYKWFHGYEQLKEKGNPWRRMFAAIVTQGVREGVFMFLIGLVIYIATKNEGKLGNFSLITSLVALISFWFVGKRLKPGNRRIAMLAGTIMIGLTILPLFYKVDYSTLLIFGIGTSLFIPLYIIPMTSRVFDLIGNSEQNVKNREELIVLREAGLIIGRVIGLAAYLIVLSQTQSPVAIVTLMFCVGIVPIAGWFFLRPFLSADNKFR